MLDEETRIYYDGGEQIKVPIVGTRILGFLIMNKHRLVGNGELIAKVWKEKREKKTEFKLRTQIMRLNRRFEGKFKIRCKVGAGYCIE